MNFTTNAFRDYNKVGIFLFVITSGLVVLFQTASRTKMPIYVRLDLLLWIGSIVMMLIRIETEIQGDQIRLGKGVWPILRWQESSVSQVSEVLLGGGRSNTSTIISINLITPTLKVPLTVGGSKADLREAMEFARTLNVPIRSSPELARIAPKWLIELAPEAF